jgi:hypothetical protein
MEGATLVFRIGNHVIDPTGEIVQFACEDGSLVLTLQNGTVIRSPVGEEEHRAFVDWMESVPLYVHLALHETYREKYQHPEQVQLPPTLFLLFQRIAHSMSDPAELLLTPTGSGSIWVKGEPTCSWGSPQEGIHVLSKVVADVR